VGGFKDDKLEGQGTFTNSGGKINSVTNQGVEFLIKPLQALG
jgi:hypothetical protein